MEPILKLFVYIFNFETKQLIRKFYECLLPDLLPNGIIKNYGPRAC